jgi:Putative peptidoglycan binding domain
MKTKRTLFLALLGSALLAVSAQAGDRHRNNGNARSAGSAPAHYSGGAIHSNSGVRYGGNRTFAPSPRMTTRSMPQFSQSRVFSGGNAQIVHRQFTPRTFGERTGNGVAQFQDNRPIQTNRFSQMQSQRSNRFAQLQGQRGNRVAQLGTGRGDRTVGNISPGHNHVFAQQSVGWHRDWDRNRDHFWNGHRCRFVNGSWFIFDIGFIPWFGWPYYDYYAYDYYPYGYPYYGYGYPSGYGYDSGAYYGSNYYDQNGYDSSYDDQGGYDSSYYNGDSYGSSDDSAEIAVVDAQRRLARAGYYHGQIDGVLGPETRHALVRYQSDRGLEPSGNLTPDTLRSLGMQQGARYGSASY